jgi:quinol monooxygenase YgiN
LTPSPARSSFAALAKFPRQFYQEKISDHKEASMKLRAVWTAVVLLWLTAWAAAQAQEQYLDIYTAQVKPEKRAEFDAISKKMAAANRQNKGDTWVTTETVYGPMNRITFVSFRTSYSGADEGSAAFFGALQKSLGPAATEKLFQDFNQCLVSSRTEFRRRRWDLSSNAPADAAGAAKLLGEARWVRTAAVRVKPGQLAAFEALLKEIKEAREKASPPVTTLVSQAVAGQEGTVFYVSTLQPSMAGFDGIPTIQKTLGEEGYARYLKTSAEVVESSETVISHFLPDLSNAPADVVAVAPDYWKPKAVVAAKSSKSVVNAAEVKKIEKQ